jgi:hypothetical protein
MTQEIKVEEGVPIPEAAQRGTLYPWEDMKIGSSFFIPGDPAKVFNKVTTAANRRKSLHPGENYTTRKVEGGVRCWRIEEPKQKK